MLEKKNKQFKQISQGLKYLQLSFSKNEHNSDRLTGRQSSVQPTTPGYLRHSGLGDYFTGGMDSANTERALISTGAPASIYIHLNYYVNK